MKTKLKKLLNVFIVLVMIVGLLPTTAFAESTTPIEEIRTGTHTFNSGTSNKCYSFVDDTSITLNGTHTININDTLTNANYCSATALWSNATLTIGGSGTLKININIPSGTACQSSKYGIDTKGLIIKDSARVEITVTGGSNGMTSGIHATDDVVIRDNASLSVNVTPTAGFIAYGIYSYRGKIDIGGTGTKSVTLTDPKGTGNSLYGIYCAARYIDTNPPVNMGNINLSGSGKLTVTLPENHSGGAIVSHHGSGTIAKSKNVGTITLDGANVELVGGNYGILNTSLKRASDAPDVIVRNSTLNVTTGQYGIESYFNGIQLDNSTVNVTATSQAIRLYGVDNGTYKNDSLYGVYVSGAKPVTLNAPHGIYGNTYSNYCQIHDIDLAPGGSFTVNTSTQYAVNGYFRLSDSTRCTIGEVYTGNQSFKHPSAEAYSADAVGDEASPDFGKFMLENVDAPLRVEYPAFDQTTEGLFDDYVVVSLSSATPGAVIYYTLDGSTPTRSSTLYNGDIRLTQTATIKAIAIKYGMTDSSVATKTYTKRQSGVTYVSTLEEYKSAIMASNRTSTLKLVDSIDLSSLSNSTNEDAIRVYGDLVIDLNGHTIRLGSNQLRFWIYADVDIIITDTSAQKTGRILQNGTRNAIDLSYYGSMQEGTTYNHTVNLTIDGITIEGSRSAYEYGCFAFAMTATGSTKQANLSVKNTKVIDFKFVIGSGFFSEGRTAKLYDTTLSVNSLYAHQKCQMANSETLTVADILGEGQELVIYNKDTKAFTKQAPTTLINTLFAQSHNLEQNALEIHVRGTHTVRFNANGGTGNMATLSGISGDYALPRCQFNPPAGKEFAGWALSENGDVLTESEISITADTTLFAIWQNKTTETQRKLAIHSREAWEAAKDKTSQYNYFELYTDLGVNRTKTPWVFDGTFSEYTIDLKGCNTGDEVFIFKLPSRNTRINIVNKSSNVAAISGNGGVDVIRVEAPNGGSHTLFVENITFDTDDNAYIVQADENVDCKLIMRDCDVTGFNRMFHNFTGYEISNTEGVKRFPNVTGLLFGVGWNNGENREYDVRDVLGAGQILEYKYDSTDTTWEEAYLYDYITDDIGYGGWVNAFKFRSAMTPTDFVYIHMPNQTNATRLDSTNRTITDSKGGTATFLPSEGKLTLNNFDCQGIIIPVGSGSTAEDQRDLIIDLIGQNTITGGTFVSGNTTYTEYAGIYTNNGSIAIGGSGGLTITIPESTNASRADGIRSFSEGRHVMISNTARVDVDVKSTGSTAYGISTMSGDIKIASGASFSAVLSTATKPYDNTCAGLYIHGVYGGNITIDTTGYVKIDNSASANNGVVYPIYNSNVGSGLNFVNLGGTSGIGYIEFSYKSVGSQYDGWKAHNGFDSLRLYSGAISGKTLMREVYDVDRGVNTVTFVPKGANDTVHTVKVYQSYDIFTEYNYLAGERTNIPVPAKLSDTNHFIGAVVAQGNEPTDFVTLDPTSNPLAFTVDGDISLIYMYDGNIWPYPTWKPNKDGTGKIADWGLNRQNNLLVPVDDRGVPTFPYFETSCGCIPYYLQDPSLSDLSAGTLITRNVVPEGKYRLAFKPSDSSIYRYSRTFDVLYDAATPVITAQPVSTSTYTQGMTAEELAVAATIVDEGTLSYQWYKSSSPYFSTETLIEGATLPTYTPDTTEAGASYYRCKVTNTNNAVGGNRHITTISAVAEVVVEVQAELIFADSTDYDIPVGVRGVVYTSDASLTASGGTAPYTFSVEPSVDGLTINSENKLVYSRPNVQAATTATIKATDSSNTTQTITIDIGEVTAPLGVTVSSSGVPDTSYSISGQVVTVTHDKACKVGYLSGGKYVAVPAVADGGSYTFTVPDGVTEVVLVVKGDANGDGAIGLADRSSISRSMLPTSHKFYKSLDLLVEFALDLDNNGAVALADRSLLSRSLLPVTHKFYKAITW